jgi:hypothetical protein
MRDEQRRAIYTMTETAALLGTSVRSVNNAAKQGKISTIKIGRRTRAEGFDRKFGDADEAASCAASSATFNRWRMT